MSVDFMAVVPASESAPSSSRVGGSAARDGGARGQDSFADMVGRLVDQPKSSQKPVRNADAAAAKTPPRVAAKGLPQPVRQERRVPADDPDDPTVAGNDESPAADTSDGRNRPARRGAGRLDTGG